MNNERSPNFSSEWFLNTVDHWLEGPQIDFKRTWKDILLQPESIFNKLVKHIIALSNVSFRTGTKCFILYGVDDITRQIVGIFEPPEYVFPGEPPKAASAPGAALSAIMEDGVLQKILDVIDSWIGPEIPEIELEFGYIELMEREPKLVAFLCINGQVANEPYYLKKNITHGGHRFRKRDVFIRKGSSSVTLDIDQVPYLRKYSDVPYLSAENWKNIITYHQSKEYQKAAEYTPYFHLLIENSDIRLMLEVEEFLESDRRRAFVVGGPGSGKSMFIRLLAYQIAQRHLDPITERRSFAEYENPVSDNYIVRDLAKELEPIPNNPVPIYFPLRTSFDEIQSFEKEMSIEIAKILGRKSKDFSIINLFMIPGSKWVLLFDGLDELHDIDIAGPKLDTWIRCLPENVKIIIATRPSISFESTGKVIKIAPLNSIEIVELAKQNLRKRLAQINDSMQGDEETEEQKVKEKDFNSWLQAHEQDLFPLLCNFRAIEALIDYVVGSFPESKYQAGIDLDKVVINTFIPYEPESQKPEADVPFISNEQFQVDTIPDSEISSVDDEDTLVANNTEVESSKCKGDAEESEKLDLNDTEQPLWITLGIGPLLRYITNHLRDENVKRQAQFSSAKIRDEEARRNLEKLAYNEDWHTPIFNRERVVDKGLINPQNIEVNTILGFIQKISLYKYQFVTHYYKLYAAAEYSCELTPDMLSTIQICPETSIVVDLHSQLLKSEGKTPFLQIYN